MAPLRESINALVGYGLFDSGYSRVRFRFRAQIRDVLKIGGFGEAALGTVVTVWSQSIFGPIFLSSKTS
jgi:hypothetical protein